MEQVKDQGDEELYAKLDSAYSSDEEDAEVSVLDSAPCLAVLTFVHGFLYFRRNRLTIMLCRTRMTRRISRGSTT